MLKLAQNLLALPNSYNLSLVKGHVSEKFLLQCQVRQSCPLSPFRSIYIEILARMVRVKPIIQGIKAYELETKVVTSYRQCTLYCAKPTEIFSNTE